MKGGYKIIDFKNVSLSGTPVTMTDVLVDLLNNYDKVVLLSNVVLSGSAKDDCFSTVLSDGAGGVKLNCYDGYISINSSGAVTYTVASASGMAGDISDLQSDLEDTNNMIAPAWSATATYTKNTIVRNGGYLYKAKQDVPTGTATSNTTYWTVTNDGEVMSFLLDEFKVDIYNLSNVSIEAGLFYKEINLTPPEGYTAIGVIGFELSRIASVNYTIVRVGISTPNVLYIGGTNSGSATTISGYVNILCRKN